MNRPPCDECGGHGIVEAPGECRVCSGLCVVYCNGLGVACVACEGTGWCTWTSSCPECAGASDVTVTEPGLQWGLRRTG